MQFSTKISFFKFTFYSVNYVNGRLQFTIFVQNRILMRKFIAILLILLVSCTSLSAQYSQAHKFQTRDLIAPALLFGVGGIIGSQIDSFKELDFGLRPDIPHTHKGFVLEDAVQYAPVGALYALKLSGVKSAHNYMDATVLVAASYCITASATWLLKQVVDEARPNGVDSDSFPSGHSSVAFMGAELLRREYKDTSPWIGYAGYAAATYTALARIKHSEHWLPDVLAGAGVGILGTRIAYWVCPLIQKHKNGFAFAGMPFYNGTVKGISLAMVF